MIIAILTAILRIFLLLGSKVKPILQKSLLHVGLLGQIWELSDVDRDGHLDMEEFSLAMFLLNKYDFSLSVH